MTDLPGADLQVIRRLLQILVEQMDEILEPGTALTTHPLFARLGLTDAAISSVASRGTLVLTTDVDLHIALQKRGADSLNFNHIRPLGWT